MNKQKDIDARFEKILSDLDRLELKIQNDLSQKCNVCGKESAWRMLFGDYYCDEHVPLSKAQKKALTFISFILKF